MWQTVVRGSAQARFAITTKDTFVGAQSQEMACVGGSGEVGVENRGLNRWGLCFRAGKPYEGHVWVKGDKRTEFHVSLESGDGSRVYAETRLTADSSKWQRLGFELTPNRSDNAGRFAITLRSSGSIALGYVFLQPGPWGRFKGLPVRDDVAQTLIRQGLTVLRYGGSMINCPEYRWKQMVGPRDRRPPYRGTWYAYSTNGWGILDFLDFCEAAGFDAIPTFCMGETPQDMAEFVDYATAPATTLWGSRRAADGHPEPYRLKYLELGNEEAVNEDYWLRFRPMAEAIWAKAPKVTLVVGDFIYSQPIVDPYNFPGAPSIKSLAAHRKILDLAKQHGREVWFDTHIGTDTPRDWQGLCGVPSFIDALARLSPGAPFKVAVFELNAGTHNLGRALGNARAIGELERIGDRVPVVCSANCLQPFRQNDNGWDQGLVFLSPSQVWGQPPYYVTQMLSRHYLPNALRADVECQDKSLDVTATASDDAKTVQLQVVNLEGRPLKTAIRLKDFRPLKAEAELVELSGQLQDINTPEQPCRIVPTTTRWRHAFAAGAVSHTFPPHSFTILRFE